MHGERLGSGPELPAKTNVHFLQVKGGSNVLEIRVWERGAGPTLVERALVPVCQHLLGLSESTAEVMFLAAPRKSAGSIVKDRCS